MIPISNALVIGGGIGGMAAAISLRRLGVAVDLVEIDPQWQVYGAGITLSSTTFRALVRLGFAAELQARGYCTDGIDMHDLHGNALGRTPTMRLADPQLPSAGGIMRPVLREIMADATVAAGVRVSLGVTFDTLAQNEQAAQVRFTDGREAGYDLVIGADGLRSKVRRTLFTDAPAPTYTGQACWRAVVPRPPDIVRPQVFMGVIDKAGCTPVSQEEMYLFLNHPEPPHQQYADADLPQLLRQRLAPYGGLIARIREGLDAGSRILYRPFDALLLPSPWYRGRVLLIGDAAHATTPHLASGAGIAVEDALVLAEELQRATTLAQALQQFMARRFDRCKSVIDYSVRLGEIEQSGGDRAEHARVQREAFTALAAPY